MDRPMRAIRSLRARAVTRVHTARDRWERAQWAERGWQAATSTTLSLPSSRSVAPATPGRLEAFFDANTSGPGIWKWRHYFPIYERHLSRFVGTGPRLMEVGVFSGGSIQMWRNYLGPDTVIYGVDIEPACAAYREPGVEILIGDQADPKFWERELPDTPMLDIVIDDGGHQPEQQVATFEALARHMAPGGVYVCEDIHDERSFGAGFHDYISGLSRRLHAIHGTETPGTFTTSPIQQSIESVTIYPFVAVIEMRADPMHVMRSEKHGSRWEPFYPTESFPSGGHRLS